MTTYYTSEHEWIRVDGDVATVGITKHAAGELGEIVFFEVTGQGEVKQGDSIAVVESVKAASDIYAPVDGEILEANPGLDSDPSLISSDPEAAGWMLTLRLTNTDQLAKLMDADAYAALIA